MWFRYDLRVEDNQALFAALDNQVCLPIFILDEGFLKLQTTSEFHLSFLKASLENLNYNLKKKFNTKLNFYEGKTTLPLIIIFQRANKEEKEFLKEILKKEKRNEDDFSEVLALINKYKAVEKSLERAEYFVNVSRDALAIFPESKDKNILQSLSNFSLNRSY